MLNFAGLSPFSNLEEALTAWGNLKIPSQDEACVSAHPRLRRILDSIPQMVWTNEPDGHQSYYNKQWYEFTGLPLGDADRVRRSLLLHPEDREQALAAWHHSLATGEPYEAEYRLRHHSGEYRWVLSRGWSETNSAGKVIRWYGSTTDIDEHRLAQNALTARNLPGCGIEASEGRLRSILDSIPQMVWTNEPDGRQSFYNKQWYAFTGLPIERADNVRRSELVHPDDLAAAMATWDRSISSCVPYEAEYRLRHHSGEYRWVLSRAVPERNASGEVSGWYGTTTDIDQQMKAREKLNASETLNRSIIQASVDSIEMLDPQGKIIFCNDAALQALEADSVEELRGTTWLNTFPRRSRLAVKRVLASAQKGYAGEINVSRESIKGRSQWWHMVVTPIPGEKDQPAGLLVMSRNVTHQKDAQDQLTWTAEHDMLTKLPNRRLFQERLGLALLKAGKSKKRVAIFLLDVDNFKQINDTMGHDAGDKLLCTFAERLQGVMGENGFVARLGGDEFAIILPDAEGEEMVVAAADRILDSLREPCIHNGQMVDCRATLGASIFPKHGKDSTTLLKQADVALYAAKAAGRGRMMIFQTDMQSEMRNRQGMLSRGRHALYGNLIVPFYQPKIELRSGRVAGFEALLRWRHPRHGIQLPGTIAAAFEDLDLAAAISDCMIDRVLIDVRSWLDHGVPFDHVAVNAAAAEFRRGNFAEQLLERLHRAQVPTSCFQLEVTETVFLGRGAECVDQALKQLSAAGVKIALDDFGTGYASLSHLKQFPVNVIKIDQSFVRVLETEADAAAIIRAVIQLGQSLGIEVVAEGIETYAQHAFLLTQGCDDGQGFLYGKAAPALRVPNVIKSCSQSWLPPVPCPGTRLVAIN